MSIYKTLYELQSLVPSLLYTSHTTPWAIKTCHFVFDYNSRWCTSRNFTSGLHDVIDHFDEITQNDGQRCSRYSRSTVSVAVVQWKACSCDFLLVNNSNLRNRVARSPVLLQEIPYFSLLLPPSGGKPPGRPTIPSLTIRLVTLRVIFSFRYISCKNLYGTRCSNIKVSANHTEHTGLSLPMYQFVSRAELQSVKVLFGNKGLLRYNNSAHCEVRFFAPYK